MSAPQGVRIEMALLEESFGLEDYIPILRNSFQTEDEPTLEFQLAGDALRRLLEDQTVLRRILERLAHDIHFVREQSANIFNNEVVLWRDPDGCFSLRMGIWTEGADSFIHDHNAMGVTGCWFGKLLIENYEIKEVISEERVKLEKKESIILLPGHNTYVKPLDQGIHRVDKAEGEFAVSLSAYSRPLPRGYIRRFDLKTGAISRIYNPSRQQKSWAQRLLSIIEKS